MIMISNFLFNITNFCIIICLFYQTANIGYFIFNSSQTCNTRYFTFFFSNLGIKICFFLTKLVTSGIFLSIFLILSSKSDHLFHICFFLTKFVVSILSTLVTNLLNSVFLHHFLEHLIIYSNLQEHALAYQYLIYLLLSLN